MTKMSTYTILLTGANSGLGFSTCCRLMDEFLSTRPASQRLHLVFTTRSASKAADTTARLAAHLDRTMAAVYGREAKTEPIRRLQRGRVTLEAERADLCRLASVKALARRLVVDRGLRVDVLICNAGVSGWDGIEWGRAVWQVCTEIVEATTFPVFKRGHVGRRLLQGQRQERDVGGGDQEPVLGETFTANVFGHYLLAHWLAPVMVRDKGDDPARVVWISSIEAFGKWFDAEDLQGLKRNRSYESSKALTDLMVLTSERPSSSKYVDDFFSSPAPGGAARRDRTESEGGKVRPRMYLTQPGVCITAISGIHWILVYFNAIALYIARWLGSPWHPISPYIGAVSTVWIALAETGTLDRLEGDAGKGKWGAATDRLGGERVVRTEVDGWGWGGRDGETPDGVWQVEARRGVNRSYSKEDREEFDARGAEVWKELESMRKDWERRLD